MYCKPHFPFGFEVFTTVTVKRGVNPARCHIAEYLTLNFRSYFYFYAALM
jgi:hypothetical protein